MDGRNEQTEIEDHTLVDIEEQATQHVVTAMKGKLQSVSGRQKTMDGRNEQTEMSEVNIPISSSHGITRSVKSPMEMDGRNVQSEIEDHTVIVDVNDNEQDTPQLKRTVEDKLQRVSSVSEHRCIYRVPKHLRDKNEVAFTPRLVSLGPFHHGNENLKAMEEDKWSCFKSFIHIHQINLDALLELVKKYEKETREFYADSIALCSDQFVQVILVDAIFVINIFLQYYSPRREIRIRSIYDDIFLYTHVFRDMMLLENQLPRFILDEILDFVLQYVKWSEYAYSDVPKPSSVIKLLEWWSYGNLMKEEDSDTNLMKEEGFVTKLSNCLFNCHKSDRKDHNSDTEDLNRYNNARHFVDFQRLVYMPVKQAMPMASRNKKCRIKSVSKLHKVGVRFEVASGKTLHDIKFEGGVLKIPGIVVSSLTETILLNLVAYDQCYDGSRDMSDYYLLMSMLIDTADDVELLVKNNILQNDMDTEEEVSKVFNNLEKAVFFNEDKFYYLSLCNQINDHCKKRRHKWMTALKQNYLDTPWKVISVIAAFILLVLTTIQTVCSVISVL